MMMVRAKMRCVENKQQDVVGDPAWKIRLQPVYADGDANKSWSKWTPSGEVSMWVTNPDAVKEFVIGKAYYVDFTPTDD